MHAQGEDNAIGVTLSLAAGGDDGAWRQLVERYTRRVYALLVHQCHDRDLAEELTQATFVKLFDQLRRKDGYKEQGKFEAYLFRIAMNHLRDEMRRRKRQARPMDMSPAADSGRNEEAGPRLAATGKEALPLQRMQHDEQVQKLRDAIATMSDADRQILHLRHTAGLAFAEIAETLDQPLGTVLARAHRALKKLKDIMGEEAMEPA